MTTPEWLTKRGGALKPGLNASTWLVQLNGEPLYRLFAAPAKGQFTCALTQTNSGKRIDAGTIYPTVETALVGGLDELRARLGW